jgi:hypothetical protein
MRCALTCGFSAVALPARLSDGPNPSASWPVSTPSGASLGWHYQSPSGSERKG